MGGRPSKSASTSIIPEVLGRIKDRYLSYQSPCGLMFRDEICHRRAYPVVQAY